MTIERLITVEKKEYTVVFSDETDSLQAAFSAGKAVVGIWNPKKPDVSLFPAEYVVENPEDVDEKFLEKVIVRRFRLPLTICFSSRLVIREFTMEDFPFIPHEKEAGKEDEIFLSQESFSAYIRNQYRFFEYGIWALIRKEDGRLVGKAGITQTDPKVIPPSCQLFRYHSSAIPPSESSIASPAAHTLEPPFAAFPSVELGYHVFRPYRRQGYGAEACQAILSYAEKQISPHIFLKISAENYASKMLASKLGFWPVSGQNLRS